MPPNSGQGNRPICLWTVARALDPNLTCLLEGLLSPRTVSSALPHISSKPVGTQAALMRPWDACVVSCGHTGCPPARPTLPLRVLLPQPECLHLLQLVTSSHSLITPWSAVT